MKKNRKNNKMKMQKILDDTIEETIEIKMKEYLESFKQNMTSSYNYEALPRYMTTNDTAKYLSVSRRSIDNFAKREIFDKIKFGNSTRYDRLQIEEYAESQKRRIK